jgi:hypothetical protein
VAHVAVAAADAEVHVGIADVFEEILELGAHQRFQLGTVLEQHGLQPQKGAHLEGSAKAEGGVQVEVQGSERDTGIEVDLVTHDDGITGGQTAARARPDADRHQMIGRAGASLVGQDDDDMGLRGGTGRGHHLAIGREHLDVIFELHTALGGALGNDTAIAVRSAGLHVAVLEGPLAIGAILKHQARPIDVADFREDLDRLTGAHRHDGAVLQGSLAPIVLGGQLLARAIEQRLEVGRGVVGIELGLGIHAQAIHEVVDRCLFVAAQGIFHHARKEVDFGHQGRRQIILLGDAQSPVEVLGGGFQLQIVVLLLGLIEQAIHLVFRRLREGESGRAREHDHRDQQRSGARKGRGASGTKKTWGQQILLSAP